MAHVSNFLHWVKEEKDLCKLNIVMDTLLSYSFGMIFLDEYGHKDVLMSDEALKRNTIETIIFALKDFKLTFFFPVSWKCLSLSHEHICLISKMTVISCNWTLDSLERSMHHKSHSNDIANKQ